MNQPITERRIHTHLVEDDPTTQLQIAALGERDADGNNTYLLRGMELARNAGLPNTIRAFAEIDGELITEEGLAEAIESMLEDGPQTIAVLFQKGPVPQHGVNGVTIEALLAICIDRLSGFQAGPYPCAENAEALHHMEQALAALKGRTLVSLARQVEGKMQT